MLLARLMKELLAMSAYLGALMATWKGYGAVASALFRTALGLIENEKLIFPVPTAVVKMQHCTHLYHCNASEAIQLSREIGQDPNSPPEIIAVAKALRKLIERGIAAIPIDR
jgi:hypothetical protein